MTADLLGQALGYAARGWPVFPCWPGLKTPVTEHGFKDAITDEAQIREWWTDNPHANVAIATGAPGPDVVDFDTDDETGLSSLAALTQAGLLEGCGAMVRTRSGGWHVYFAGTAQRNSTLRSKRGDLSAAVDFRGAGGYVIAPPSYVEADDKPGGYYEQVTPGAADPAIIDWRIVRDLIVPPAPFQQPQAGNGGPPDDRSMPGNDYAARTSWPDILSPHGWRQVRQIGAARYWCRPGKAGHFVSASTRDEGGLWVWSTSTDFDSETLYSKFGAYTVLAGFGRDHKAAARSLAGQGYGTKKEERTKSAATVTTKEDETTPHTGPAVPSADPAMYAGILGDIVAAAAPTTEADPVGIYASLLAGAGVIMNSTPYVRVGNTKHPLLIWPLLLGRTGSGRKGEATSTAELFLRNADPAFDTFTVSGLSSGEGLIERIRDKDEEQDTPAGKFKQPGGGTDDKRLLVIETEFASVLARSKREGSTLAAVQRQAWDGRALSVLNRKQLKASASHVAIIGHVTPQEFRLRLAEADMTGGTYNRYLPLFVERSRRLPIPEGVADHVVQSLSASLRRAIRNAAQSGQLQLGEEATQLWAGELYDELTAGDDEDLAEAEFTRRAAPYCLRIAGLFTVLDGRRLIGKDDLVAAAAVIRYSIASAKFILDRQARDPRLDRIRRAIDGAGPAGLSRSDISGLFSRNLPKAKLDELLAELVSHDEYEESLQHGRGRPAQTYRRVVSSSFVPKDSER